MSCLPGMPCYGGGRVVYPRTCGVDPCLAHKTNTDLVFYSGPNLPTLGVNTCDDLTTILEKIDYLFSQGVITSTTTTTSSSTSTTSTTSTSTSTTTSTSSTTTTTSAPISGLTEAYIILQTGQSNAVGRGAADPTNEVVVPLGAYEYRSSTDAVYALTDPTGIPGDDSQATNRSMNPALAKRIIELTGKPVIIVCAAVGNTNITYWNGTTSTLRTTALSRWNAVKSYCATNGITILGEFIHWLQGENDAAISMATDAYVDNLNTMIDKFESEFNPDKTFVTRVGYDDAPVTSADAERIMLAQSELNLSKDEMILTTNSPATFFGTDKATGVHYTVKGYNQVGQEVAQSIYNYITTNKKTTLTEPVAALQDPVGYFDDIYNFRSLTPGQNADLTELFDRNNLSQDSGTGLTFDSTNGLIVSGINPTSPTIIRELTNAHDWSIEMTFQNTSPIGGMAITGRSSGNWEDDWFWISGTTALYLKANNVTKAITFTGVDFSSLSNLVLTYTSSSNTINAYVNGALKHTSSDWAFTSFKLEKFFRSYQTVPNATLAFNGIVERIRIVKKVLSTWEFDRSPNITTPPSFDYDFQFNGSIAEAQGDISTAMYTFGTNLSTTATFDADGIVFDESQYMRLGSQKTMAQATIEFRVKHTVTPTNIEFFCGNRLVADSGGFDNGIGLSGNTMYFGNNGTAPGYVSWNLAPLALTYTNFNIYKFVYNGTTVELFVNSVSQGTKSITGDFVLGIIGHKHPTQAYGFQGTMDYFKIKNSI